MELNMDEMLKAGEDAANSVDEPDVEDQVNGVDSAEEELTNPSE